MASSAKKLKRPQLKRVFLGCEGNSERSYGAWLQALARDLHVPIVIDTYPETGGGDQPYEIIERCISEMLNRQRRYGPYSVRGILLDSDNLGNNPERDSEAEQMARANKVRLIFQEFEHEAFLLRHITRYENQRPKKGEGREALKAAWPEYKRRFGKIQLYDRFSPEDLRRACTVEPKLRRFLKDIGFPV